MHLFKSNSKRFYGLLRRRGRQPDDAEDLVQEAYLRLLTYIHKGGQVVTAEAFLARTVVNLDIDHSRRKRPYSFDHEALEGLGLVDPTPGPEQQLADEQFIRRTTQLLDEGAGERTRDAFLLHCLEGMTYDEIGAQLNLSGRSVERHIAKAIAILTLNRNPKP